MDMSLSKLQETMKDREAWRATVHGVTIETTIIYECMYTYKVCSVKFV